MRRKTTNNFSIFATLNFSKSTHKNQNKTAQQVRLDGRTLSNTMEIINNFAIFLKVRRCFSRAVSLKGVITKRRSMYTNLRMDDQKK